MKEWGNKSMKGRMCSQCLSRWERSDIHRATETGITLNPHDLVTFGKHTGSTYQEVYQTDKPYCQWVMMTAQMGESSEEVTRLATYIYNQ